MSMGSPAAHMVPTWLSSTGTTTEGGLSNGGMSEPDAELVARIQVGDTAAFELLMRRHFRMAFLIAFAQLGNRADAEDVCQDAFVRCWERVGECRDASYLFRKIVVGHDATSSKK